MNRLIHSLAVLIVVALFAFVPSQGVAQVLTVDTLDIAALPPGNVNNVINSDTLTGGVRAHPNRVYRLTRGLVYQVTQPINTIGGLHIVATDGTTRPPVLAPAIRSDNSSVDHLIEVHGKGSKVEISNVYFISIRADQVQLGWSRGLDIWSDSIFVKLRGVIFDAFTESALRINVQWTKLDVQDCVFRNSQHSSSYFGGQPFMTDAPNALDTCKFVNNTFFANNSYLWSIRGYDRFSVFDHNTLVYGVVNPFLTRQGTHMHVKNNIFYAMHAYGGTPADLWGASFLNWPDTAASPIVQIRAQTTYKGQSVTGPEVYLDPAHGVDSAMLVPALRTDEFVNNVYFNPAKLTNFYQAWNDTVATYDSLDLPYAGTRTFAKRTLTMSRFVNDFVQWEIDSLFPVISPMVSIKNNWVDDPGYNTAVSNHLDSLIGYIWRIGVDKRDRAWFFNPNGNLYPPAWPLPENLAYSNTMLQTASTDGYPMGDLNWFPTQKALWLAAGLDGVKAQPTEVPAAYTLSQNYPNPFNPTTQIAFTIPKAGNVLLKVYNTLGQEVSTLINGQMAAGQHEVTFNAQNLASGIYFYRLTAGSYASTMKMVLMK